MKGELTINGKDAYMEWGVSMGEGFLDVIEAPLSMKAFVESSSRLEHGKTIITETARMDSREITLTFYIKGASADDYRIRMNQFVNELYKGTLRLSIPVRSDEVYKLVYLGKSITYKVSRDSTFSKFSARFCEPNPVDRK